MTDEKDREPGVGSIFSGYYGEASRARRRAPLAGFLVLPAQAWRSLPRRGKAAAGLAGAALAVAIALAVPPMLRTGDDVRERQRRAAAANLEAIRRTVTEDQRPRRARLAPARMTALRRAGGIGTERGRALVAGTVAASVLADARERARAGGLEHDARRVGCEPVRDGRRSRGALVLTCLAETGERGRYEDRPLLTGYRFRARFVAAGGGYAWCKQNPRPLHADQEEFVAVPLANACVG